MKHSSWSVAKVAAALVAIQAEVKAIAKDGKNPHFKSKFVTFDAIVEHVRPIAAKHGCAIVQDAEATATPGVIFVSTTVVHESGEWIAGGVPVRLAKDDPQGAGSAVTYAKRYGAAAMFFISADEDDDGNAASRPARRAQQSEGSRPPRAAATPQSGESPPASSAPKSELFFGRPRGTPLGEYDDAQLRAMLSWCVEKNTAKTDPKMHQRIQTIRAILADRSLGQPTTQAELDAVAVSRLADKPDGLPF